MGSENRPTKASRDETIFESLDRHLLEWSKDPKFQSEFERWKEGEGER